MQHQNFLWLPFSGNRNAVVNLNHIGPRFDEKENHYVGYNANCESKYICLPIPRPYTSAELDRIGELTVTQIDPRFQHYFEGCPQRAISASRANLVAVAISKFEKSITTC
jgi:hypothetical protein